jgi:hypothetical protein
VKLANDQGQNLPNLSTSQTTQLNLDVDTICPLLTIKAKLKLN